MLEKKKRRVCINNIADTLYAPVSGEVVPLTDVNDVAFASGMFGRGAAIMSDADILFSVSDGVISNLSCAGHAVILSADCGAEILIHIGIDTTALKRNYFNPLVFEGDRVRVGEPLIEFDKEQLLKEGYDPTIMVAVLNSDKFDEIKIATDFADGARPFLKLIRIDK